MLVELEVLERTETDREKSIVRFILQACFTLRCLYIKIRRCVLVHIFNHIASVLGITYL
jgi:hypothetical protein